MSKLKILCISLYIILSQSCSEFQTTRSINDSIQESEVDGSQGKLSASTSGLPRLAKIASETPLQTKWSHGSNPPLEIPPALVALPNSIMTIFSTDFSYLCKGVGNLVTGPGTATSANCLIDTYPAISQYKWTTGLDAPTNIPAYDSRRSYHGVFSAHLLGGSQVLSINHGENKNWFNPANNNPNLCSQNTVDPSISCFASPNVVSLSSGGKGCASGIYNGVWKDCVKSYFGFVTASVRSSVGTGLQDFGPIVWPANGYLTLSSSELPTYLGLRQPSSIIHNGFLYVFFIDGSQGYSCANGGPINQVTYKCTNGLSPLPIIGRGPGLKLARAPLLAMGLGPFKNYLDCPAKDETCFTENSLPPGFSNQNIRAFYKTKGGRSTHLLANAPVDLNRFSVARIKGTQFFLGISQENGPVFFRLSKDLINWSAAINVNALSSNPSGSYKFLYPVFMDKQGTSNNDIDPSDFYVLGTSLDNQLSSMRFSIELDYSSLIPKEESNHILSISKLGAGLGTVTSSPVGINSSTSCSASYARNALVTLTASAAAGSTFAGWSGACTGFGSCSISMTEAKSVTATFVPELQGFFKVGGGIYYSNGSAFCGFSSWSSYIASGGSPTLAGVAELQALPQYLTNHGLCR